MRQLRVLAIYQPKKLEFRQWGHSLVITLVITHLFDILVKIAQLIEATEVQ